MYVPEVRALTVQYILLASASHMCSAALVVFRDVRLRFFLAFFLAAYELINRQYFQRSFYTMFLVGECEYINVHVENLVCKFCPEDKQ